MSNTNTPKKMTKKDYFNALLAKYPLTEDEQTFVKHEIELLEKKNTAKDGKPTAKQEANEKLMKEIYSAMLPNRLYTCTDIIKNIACCAEFQTSKVSYLMRTLVADGKAERIEEKGKALFRRVEGV